jgi:hypothetical protein
MPLIIGSTTPRAAATVTAASKALPPSSRISRPARVARGFAELTMPEDPVAGLVEVFWVGSGTELEMDIEVDDPVISPAASSTEEVASSPAFSREALSGEADWAHELSTTKSNPTKSNKTRFPTSLLTGPT